MTPVAAVEQTSGTSLVLLRRAYGSQDIAFAASLPLGLMPDETLALTTKVQDPPVPDSGPHSWAPRKTPRSPA